MQSTNQFFIFLFIVSFSLACKNIDGENPVLVSDLDSSSYAHIKFFGFTLIDTYYDDPTDKLSKTNYADEVHSFSNLADILVVNPDDDLTLRIRQLNDFEMKAVLHLNELFFELIDANSPSEANYNLRSDYVERWAEFMLLNEAKLNASSIGAFYVGEEPTWNGVSFAELDAACTLVKSAFPSVPIMVIEAYPSINDLQIPTSADWIGFDHYFIKKPSENVQFLSELAALKNKFSTNEQRLVFVMDAHYIPWAHGDYGGIVPTDLKAIAIDYFNMAISEPKTVAIIGYAWPSGFDAEDMLGARALDDATKAEYARIGKLITGKP